MKIDRIPCTSAFYLWNGISAMYYSSHLTPFHSHNTLQLIFDVQGSFKLRTQHSYWRNYRSLVIKENTIHRLDTNKSVQLIIYIDPSLDIAEKIKSIFLGGSELSALETGITDIISVEHLQKSLLIPDESLLRRLTQEIIKKLVDGINTCSVDNRIKQIKQFIQQDPTILSVQILAQEVFLSESRLRALFKQQTGISLYRYIILNRLIQSIRQLMNGSSIEEAALYAGFEDSSHLHKTMIKMVGLRPSGFIKNNKELNIMYCGRFPMRIESAMYNEQFIFEKNIIC